MPKRKVRFEDGDGEFDLEDDLPSKKVTLSRSGYWLERRQCGGVTVV